MSVSHPNKRRDRVAAIRARHRAEAASLVLLQQPVPIGTDSPERPGYDLGLVSAHQTDPATLKENRIHGNDGKGGTGGYGQGLIRPFRRFRPFRAFCFCGRGADSGE
jgi:hypothetical protein